MKHKWMVDPVRFGLCLAMGVFFAAMAVVMLTISRQAAAGVVAVIGLIYLYNAVKWGALVEITPEHVSKTTSFKKVTTLQWSEIAEVCVMGTKVFRSNTAKRTGPMYICFLSSTRTEDEKFDMLLKWPPSKDLVLWFTPQRAAAVSMLWDGYVTTYNVGALVLKLPPKDTGYNDLL